MARRLIDVEEKQKLDEKKYDDADEGETAHPAYITGNFSSHHPPTRPPPSFGLRPICLNNRSVSAGVYRRTHWPTLKYTKSTKTTPGAAASTSTDTCMHIYDSALGWHTIGCACVSVCEYLSVRLVYGCVCPHPQTGKGVAEVQGHSTRRLRRPG